MLNIDEMNTEEIHDLLQKVGHGHLGCALDGHPYVLPMHYYFNDPDYLSVYGERRNEDRTD